MLINADFTKRIIIVFILFVSSCNTLKGHRGMSEDIEESKKRNVFVAEYSSKSNPYVINDTIQLNIKSAWIEKRWAYPSDLNETTLLDGYQLIIHVDEVNMLNYSKTWAAMCDDKLYLRRCGKSCLMMDSDSLLSNEISWKIFQGRDYKWDTTRQIIGGLSLTKKN